MADSILAVAPRRTLKTWSVALLAITVVGNLAIIAFQTLGEANVLSLTPLAYLNAGLAFLTGVARFLAQQISLTYREKVDILTATANAPLLPDEASIVVKIDGKVVM